MWVSETRGQLVVIEVFCSLKVRYWVALRSGAYLSLKATKFNKSVQYAMKRNTFHRL